MSPVPEKEVFFSASVKLLFSISIDQQFFENLTHRKWGSRPEKGFFLLLNAFIKKMAANCPHP